MPTNLLIIGAVVVVLAAQAATVVIVRKMVRRWCADVYKSGYNAGMEASEPFTEVYRRPNTPKEHRWWCTAHIKDVDQVSGDLYEACETITHVAGVDIVVYQTAEQAEPLVSITGSLEDMTFTSAREVFTAVNTLLGRIAEGPYDPRD